MKPSRLLHTLPIIAAIAFPATFAAQAFGVPLPTWFDASHTFGVFVIGCTLQTLFADYRSVPVRPVACGERTPADHSMFPLAA